MAAAAREMRAYLRDVIGISDSPVGDVDAIRDAVRNEGLDSITDLAEFEVDDIKVVCSSVRKPGGTVDDPVNPGLRIPNPGHSIPAIAEKRLKVAAYGAAIYNMLGRPITGSSLSRIRLREFERHQKTIDEHEDPESMPPISKTNGIMKAMDVVPVNLRERIGTKKVALNYIIRDNATPTLIEPLEVNRVTSNNYETLMDELIDRVPHDGPEYTADNARVYQILQEMVGGSSHEASIKAFRRARDGRAAYFALLQHNLGSSKWDRVIDHCENYLLRNEWNGKNIRFTLKMHITKHREAHNELVRASQFVDYELPNGHTRVGRLIKSITSKDGAILAAITNIHGDRVKRNDFEEAADFLLLTAPDAKEIERSYRISALGLTSKGGNDNKGNDAKNGFGRTGVELRYYKKHEYDKLRSDQKKELREWRASNGTGGKGGGKSRISALEAQLQEMIEQNKLMQAKISSISTTKASEREMPNPLLNPLNQRNSS